MRAVASLTLAAGALAALALPAAAASFDCAKARAPDEIAICANPTSRRSIPRWAGLWFAYSQVPFLMGMNGNRQDEAHAFLRPAPPAVPT